MFGIVLMCPAAIWAQEIKAIDVKPGLWENTTTSEMSGVLPNMPQISPDQLARIPPEQRARVEAMMKGGVGAPQTNTIKACVTKEQLSKPLFDNGDKSCAYKLTNSSSSTQQIHVECDRNNNKSTGDITFERVDSEHVKGTAVLKVSGGTTNTAAQGMNVKLTFSNKFLSSDCGSVKPANSDK
jgi:hypothetical protein